MTIADSAAPLVGELRTEVTIAAIVPLEVFTMRYAIAVLRAHRGNKSRAAEALGVSRHLLGRLVKRAERLGMVA